MMSGTTGAFDPRRMKPSPMSNDVGSALMQRRQMSEMGAPAGGPPMGDMPVTADDMSGDETSAAALPGPAPQQVLSDTTDPFDPATEHSASASRNALAEGIQRAMGLSKPSNPRVRPAYNKVQLSQLGLPAAEIELMEMNDPAAYGG